MFSLSSSSSRFRRLCPALIPVMVFISLLSMPFPSLAQEPDVDVQELKGRLESGSVVVYRLFGLDEGQTLYAYAQGTSGNLDPLVAIVAGDEDVLTLASDFQAELRDALLNDEDPIKALQTTRDKYFLAWDDDSGEDYDSAMQFDVPESGDYLLIVFGALSTLDRDTFGHFRLLVGRNEPDVLTGEAAPTGGAIVHLDPRSSPASVGVHEYVGELTEQKSSTTIQLADLDEGDTLYIFIEALSGDLVPRVVLYDFGDKPITGANLAGTSDEASFLFKAPEDLEGYRLKIEGCCEDTGATAGKYRLLAGVNAPEALAGNAEEQGRTILLLPIEVKVGLKLQQITDVDQKAENYNAVVTLAMEWNDPHLAFSPSECNCSVLVYDQEEFADFLKRTDSRYPEFTFFNQQGNRWVQNRLAGIYPDGRAVYFERFTTTFQAPDFDFTQFPFDTQQFYIRVDGLFPEDAFYYVDYEDFTEVGTQLGEEEWYLTDYSTSVTSEKANTGSITSRYSFGFQATRHLDYYIFRFFIPITLIIIISWITFFLKDFGKRIDVTSANLLLFIAYNFTIANELPRLGYQTFMDTILIATFIVSVIVVVYNVAMKRMEQAGQREQADRIDKYMVTVYPLVYILGFGIVVAVYFL